MLEISRPSRTWPAGMAWMSPINSSAAARSWELHLDRRPANVLLVPVAVRGLTDTWPMTTSGSDSSFAVIPGDPASRVVVHVPHSSTAIPSWVRERITLSDDDLVRELELMTDARTDEIAEAAAGMASIRPWLFVNRCSRLVVDPERFPDPADEPMAAPEIGMGAVYTRTAHGEPLRENDPAHNEVLLDRYFRPYGIALTQLVDDRLAQLDTVTIIDLHSFPLEELPYERLHHADAPRPECCIGVDPTHTPSALAAAAARAFAGLGETGVNEPFAGTYVPLAYYTSQDTRVASVMVELRRDTYLQRGNGIPVVAGMLSRLVDDVSSSTMTSSPPS